MSEGEPAIDGATAAARLPEGVIEAAIGWAVKLDYNEPAPQARRAFERWLQADRLHALAWERVASMRQPFDAAPPALLRAALDAAEAKRTLRRRAAKLLSLAGVALGAGWLVREHAPWQRLFADASTGVGERRTLRLADGSTVTLNTDSAIAARLTAERRLVVLRRGEILVATGADAQAQARRPFWVETPYGALQALGTRFTVRLDEARARVGVQEGAVDLHPLSGGVPRRMRAGENRWLAAAGTEAADLQGFDPDGWADGVIAGRNIRLADLVAELARYRAGHLGCDERVAALRLSGLFHTADTDRALQFLAQTLPVEVSYRTRFWVSVGPRA